MNLNEANIDELPKILPKNSSTPKSMEIKSRNNLIIEKHLKPLNPKFETLAEFNNGKKHLV